MNREQVISDIIPHRKLHTSSVTCFAPVNIALIKYWGKRNKELNLPVTSSLSITLPEHGTHTSIQVKEIAEHQIYLNEELQLPSSSFYQKLCQYLSLFKVTENFIIHTRNTIPTGAGLASSASGFAAIAKGLNTLYNWQLTAYQQSILARLGSGSACRSLWPGFVLWEAGQDAKGEDSHGIPLPYEWPELAVGILTISSQQKSISSREAMNLTVATSPFYALWPEIVANHLEIIEPAIAYKDFTLMGEIAEKNAIAMHATMHTAWPSIYYHQPETLAAMHAIWQLRQQGLAIYFTQDAGPNLKLLFLRKDEALVKKSFSEIEVLYPFPQMTAA